MRHYSNDGTLPSVGLEWSRNRRSHWFWRVAALLIVLGCAPCSAGQEANRSFEVQLDPSIAGQAAAGRLFVFLSQRPSGEPRLGPNWFAPEPFFASDVTDFAAGEVRILDETAAGFPGPLSALPAGTYRAQAVLDQSLDSPHIGAAPGNGFSRVESLEVREHAGFSLSLRLDRVVADAGFPTDEKVQEVVIRSELLSRFFQRDMLDRCSVVLPPSYAQQPERRYPTAYLIPGFGGDHRSMAFQARRYAAASESAVEFIVVGLSGLCRWGHHEYADSATNGPRGEALIEELIPHIDRTFRTVAAPTARFVAGHSSGGWSSLWLQVTYPEVFGGVWSLSPDPIDFRDFQQIDLYARPPLSLYYDEQGQPRPIARRGETPMLWFPGFARMDDVIGRGGQLRSFEAVFSPRDQSGLPRRLWDRTTGTIDPQVAQAWEAYDIRLKLERNWQNLAPRLRGKLHIATGELDTFYLEGAVERLAESLRQLGSDAEIEILPGCDHGGTLTGERWAKIRRQMSAAFLQYHQLPETGSSSSPAAQATPRQNN